MSCHFPLARLIPSPAAHPSIAAKAIHARVEGAATTLSLLETAPMAAFSDLLADIHDRMPLNLGPGAYDCWLDPASRDTQALLKLRVPFGGSMRRYPVSAGVHPVQTDDPDCATPIQLEPTG